jgi:hypothetical protein
MENVIISREAVKPVKLTARHHCGGYLITVPGVDSIRKVGKLFEVCHKCDKCHETVCLDRYYPAIEYEPVEAPKNYRLVSNVGKQIFEVSVEQYRKLTVYTIHVRGGRIITGATQLIPNQEYRTVYEDGVLTVEVLRSEHYLESINCAGILYCFGPLPPLHQLNFGE